MFYGYWGQPISVETGTSKLGTVKRYYKCLGHKRGNKCKKSIVRKDVIENLIIDTTYQVLDSPITISNIADRIIEVNQKRLRDQSIVTILTKELTSMEGVGFELT